MSLQPAVQESPCFSPGLLPWFAIRAKSKQEKIVALILNNKSLEVYLPVYWVHRRWSDRTVNTELPLFPGYLFCRLDVTKRMPILTTPGVVGIVSFGKDPIPIPEREIAAVQTVLRSGVHIEPSPF